MESSAIVALNELLARPEGSWTLADGALAIARLARPNLDPAAAFEHLEELGGKARLAVGQASHPRFVAAGIARTLFVVEGFRVWTAGGESASGLHLDRLFETKVGAPPLLAVLFIEVARRTGFRFEPIALPGASLLRRDHRGAAHLFDPAAGAREVTLDECRRIAARGAGAQAEFREGWLRPVSSKQVLARLLGALKAAHWRASEHDYALAATEMLLAIRPDDPREIRDFGRLLFLQGRYREAVEAFESYLAQNPAGEDADAVRMLLIEARAGLSMRA